MDEMSATVRQTIYPIILRTIFYGGLHILKDPINQELDRI